MASERRGGGIKEGERAGWLVYSGGIVEPEDGVKYTHVRVEGTTRIDDGAFVKCGDELRVVIICEGVEEIGCRAYSGCASLESVAFPSTLALIDEDAFRGCDRLKSVKLCEGIVTIGGSAFHGCKSLGRINLPSTLTSIGEYAFKGCEALKSIQIPSNVALISRECFLGCTSLTHVTLHDGVETIGLFAFKECTSLQDIRLASTLQEICRSAFYYCISLGSIHIPSSVTFVGNSAFSQCLKLKNVTFQSPHQLRKIESFALYRCCALEEIKIPPTVTEIRYKSFESCENLKKVDLCGGSPRVDEYAFDNCPKFEYGNIIATGKMDIGAFRRFARIDLSRRIDSMIIERKRMIQTKLNAIRNQIIADPGLTTGRVPPSMQDGLAKIHGLITYWELKEPTTILELAIWKWKLMSDANDFESRQQIRVQCGRDMQVIVSGVLQFFDYNSQEGDQLDYADSAGKATCTIQ